MDEAALLKFGYGVYIVSSFKENKLNGQLANTVFQVTAFPPQIAISINKQNLTHECIRTSQLFSVSVLQQDTPFSFMAPWGFRSGRELDKFENIDHSISSSGCPIVKECSVAFIEAKVTQELDVGTHTIFIGEVMDSHVINHSMCMTYSHYHDVKKYKTPDKAPTYHESHSDT